MLSAHHVAWAHMEGERAFGQAIRARRRASLARRALRRCADCARLIVHDERTLPRRNGGLVREIPLDAITGTFEAGRALDFDNEFRPSKRARKRWLRVWVGEHTGAGLPPIDVVQVGDGGFASATATTACRSPAPAARSRSTPSSPRTETLRAAPRRPASGSSQVGMCPQPASRNSRAAAGTAARPRRRAGRARARPA